MPNKYILITTTTCTKCRAVKKSLIEKLGSDLVIINETDKDFNYLIEKYSLSSAPSLIDITDSKVIDIDNFLSS